MRGRLTGVPEAPTFQETLAFHSSQTNTVVSRKVEEYQNVQHTDLMDKR